MPLTLPPNEGGWVPIPLSGGIGSHWARPLDQMHRLRTWFGNLDSWNPFLRLPLLNTAVTPASFSNSKTDFACLEEMIGGDGVWRVYLVKGTRLYAAPSSAPATFTALTGSPVTGAEGRSILECYQNRTTLASGFPRRLLVWACGESANVQYVDPATPTTVQAMPGTALARAHCVFHMRSPISADIEWRLWALLCVGTPSGNEGEFRYYSSSGSGWASPPQPAEIPGAEIAGAKVMYLGLRQPDQAAFALNNRLWVWGSGSGSSTALEPEQHDPHVGIIAGGGVWRDWWIIAGQEEICLYHPTRPRVVVGPWTVGRGSPGDGVPPDWSGKWVALYVWGDIVVALWQLDGGNTIPIWGRAEPDGRWTWHPRAAIATNTPPALTGSSPLTCGTHILMSENTLAGKRRLWIVTADGTTGRAWYQDHPFPGLDPSLDTTLSYENGNLQHWTPWLPLLSVGPLVAWLQQVAADLSVSSTETFTVDYRVNYDTSIESTASSWQDIALYDSKASVQQEVEGGVAKALSVQFQFTADRGGTATLTPIVREFYARFGLRPATV